MRPKSAHAALSGVGEHPARESESAKWCAKGKERVANAHPRFNPGTARSRGFCFLRRQGQREGGIADPAFWKTIRMLKAGSAIPPYIFTTTVAAIRSSTVWRLGSHSILKKPIRPIATPAT